MVKLFVWEEVLQDWSYGMIVVLAPDLETALFLTPGSKDGLRLREEMGRVTPTVIELSNSAEPQIWWVDGGA